MKHSGAACLLAVLVASTGCGGGSIDGENVDLAPAGVKARSTGNPNPGTGVLPPQSHPHGSTYGEWSAAWWQWALSLPATAHPLFDTADCSTGQTDKVWFLGGKFCSTSNPNCNAQSAARTCAIPTGTALFFPIVNTECSTIEGNGPTEAQLRACAQGGLALADNLEADIDGQPINDLTSYVGLSPLFPFTLASHDNILRAVGENIPNGASDQAVADGYYLFLNPLPPGAHTIHFAASFPSFNFSFDITYHIIVAPPHHP